MGHGSIKRLFETVVLPTKLQQCHSENRFNSKTVLIFELSQFSLPQWQYFPFTIKLIYLFSLYFASFKSNYTVLLLWLSPCTKWLNIYVRDDGDDKFVYLISTFTLVRILNSIRLHLRLEKRVNEKKKKNTFLTLN